MSIFFEFEVGPTGRRFRRAVDHDVKDIRSFISEHESNLFGDVNIGLLIELSVLSICMVNENKEVTGFLCLSDHPNLPAVDPASWEFWMRNMYQKFYLPSNTLFIHYMCCSDTVGEYFLEEALFSVFIDNSYLWNIILIVPPSFNKSYFEQYHTFKKKNFYRYYSSPVTDAAEVNSQYLCVATRHEFCPRLRTRRAVEEDNDDLIEILNKKCTKLTELYGNYYISEVIGRHPESKRKVLVAEYQEQAVGLMCLNTDLNYKQLQTHYDLNCFYGLCKATRYEKERLKRSNVLMKMFADPIMRGKWSPFKKMKTPPKTTVENKKQYRRSTVLESSKLNFATNTNELPLYYMQKLKTKSKEMKAAVSIQSTAADMIQEEDSFEYDIVNIDASLLSFHVAVSTEQLFSRKSIMKLAKSNSSFNKPRDNMALLHCIKKSSLALNRKINTARRLSQNAANVNKAIANLEGEPNAFMVELLALRGDFDDREDFSLLEACFEAIPDLEYCIIRTPCNEKSFSLLKHFTYVPTRKEVETEFALYVAHRSSVRGKLRVRKAELIDLPQISQLLNNLKAKETLWTLQNSIIFKKEHQSFILMSGLSIVGIGILEPPDHIEYIRAKFNLEFYHNHKYHILGSDPGQGFSFLRSVIIHPAFEMHYRFFAREMMRMSGSTSLLWLTAYRSKWLIQNANTMASHMVPLIPRSSNIDCVSPYNKANLNNQQHYKRLACDISSFSSWYLNKRLTSVSKINVDTKILIVGASRTAIGFLNTLLFSNPSSYLSFTNVTLVSSDGLPYLLKTDETAELMFKKYRTNSDSYLKSIPYSFYMNIHEGTMVKINKQEKFITLKDGCKCYYDLLFLLSGKQYQYPGYTAALKSKERDTGHGGSLSYVCLDVPTINVCEIELPSIDKPGNVFVINDIHDANMALEFINELQKFGIKDKIVVYGSTIEAYCCITALLELRVPANKIVFVDSFPPENNKKTRVSVFANEYVDETINQVMKTLGLTVYEAHFQNWCKDFDNLVTHVEFISYYEFIKIECSAFFYYGTRGVNLNAFTAMNESGMAYDGGIVIDANFRTKDPSIYAAGPITRYCRRYYALNKRHKFYDTYEVGEKLGTHIRNKLDPLFGASNVNKNAKCNAEVEHQRSRLSNDYTDRIPSLKKPIVIHCILPGSLQYLNVRSPGKKIPHHYVQIMGFNGHIIETFKQGYFMLHLNSSLEVDTIVCLTSDMVSLDNFKNLYGHSAVTLNNVHVRYQMKNLNNLYKFFRSPWAFYLYHDHGDELLAMAQELIPEDASQDETMREVLTAITEKYYDGTQKSKTKIKSSFTKSPYIQAITDYVLQWVAENEILLPMYLQPWQATEFNYDNENNPYFIKKQ